MTTVVGEELKKYLNLVDDNKDFAMREEILAFSDFELTVLNHLMSGNSIRSISRNLGVSRPTTERAAKKCTKMIKRLKEKYQE